MALRRPMFGSGPKPTDQNGRFWRKADAQLAMSVMCLPVAERRELPDSSRMVHLLPRPLSQLSSCDLAALGHGAGAGIGRTLDTRQPSDVLTSTWFIKNLVCCGG